MNEKLARLFENLKEPEIIGSYAKDDALLILKDISGLVEETFTNEREENIQNGGHYSQMLPIEYEPSSEYVILFNETLKKTSYKVAHTTAIVAENIIKRKGKDVVLVSLARAGTPVGILIKRYIKAKYDISLIHYSISIIRDIGIDVNALGYILKNNPDKKIQFIDGWTGKGVIKNVLLGSLKTFEEEFKVKIDSDLTVLADPSHSVENFGTREDFLIPSACLNSTVSGLTSRTFYRDDIIDEFDYHGAKIYKEWSNIDMSNYFVDEISKHFDELSKITIKTNEDTRILNKGMQDVNRIKRIFCINDINLIKPGVGETTRVLLRRLPWKILVKDMNDENIKHILLLAKEKNVQIEVFSDMIYSACGLIQEKLKNAGLIQ